MIFWADVVSSGKGESVAELDAEFCIGVVAEALRAESVDALADGVVGVVESASDSEVGLEVIASASDAVEWDDEPDGIGTEKDFVAIFGLTDQIEICANFSFDGCTLAHCGDPKAIPLATEGIAKIGIGREEDANFGSGVLTVLCLRGHGDGDEA